MTPQQQITEQIIREINHQIAPIKSLMEQNKKKVEQAARQTRDAIIVRAIDKAKTHAQTTSRFAFLLTENMAHIQDICDAKCREIDEAEQCENLPKKIAKSIKKQIETEISRKIKREIVEPTKQLAAKAASMVANEENPSFQLSDLNSFAMLSVKLIMATGFLFIFFYCALILQWMPIGISLSETAGILLLGLAVGTGYLFFLFPAAKLISKGLDIATKSTNNKIIWVVLILIIVMYCVLGFIGLQMNSFAMWLWYGHFALCSAAAILAFYDVNTPKNQKIQVVSFMITLGISFSILATYKFILPMIGFTRPKTTMQLSDDDFKLVQSQAIRHNFTNIKFNKENRTVFPVDIKLRGIGTHTLIELHKKESPKGKEKTIQFEIKTNESKVIQVK